MIFNPHASKHAQEIVFSRKASASNHGAVYFNNVPVVRENIQKHVSWFLDSKLNFFDHTNETIKKATKWVNVMRKMNLLYKLDLLTVYKSFVRPHLHYGELSNTANITLH